MDNKDGKFCEYRDYVKLEAKMKLEMEILQSEVEFWKSASTDNGIACNQRANENQGLENEIARLKTELTDLKSTADRFKAEVDSLMTNPTSRLLRAEREENARLTKSGDAMAKRTEFFQKRWDADELCQEVEAWNAAKEGKQS